MVEGGGHEPFTEIGEDIGGVLSLNSHGRQGGRSGYGDEERTKVWLWRWKEGRKKLECIHRRYAIDEEDDMEFSFMRRG